MWTSWRYSMKGQVVTNDIRIHCLRTLISEPNFLLIFLISLKTFLEICWWCKEVKSGNLQPYCDLSSQDHEYLGNLLCQSIQFLPCGNSRVCWDQKFPEEPLRTVFSTSMLNIILHQWNIYEIQTFFWFQYKVIMNAEMHNLLHLIEVSVGLYIGWKMCQYEQPSGSKFLSALPLGEPSNVVIPQGWEDNLPFTGVRGRKVLAVWREAAASLIFGVVVLYCFSLIYSC